MPQSLRALLFIFLFGFLTFSNGLNNPFMIDDHAFFEEKLQNIKFLPLHFLPDKNQALHIEGESPDPFYRPLATVIPMLCYLSFRDNTTGYHVTNLILFCLAAWGIYLFLRRLKVSFEWAFLAAVLYLIHPVNGVCVNYITASIFPVQVMLMLSSLYFLSLQRPVFCCVFYLLSTFCHETAMALPFYAFVFYLIFERKKDIETSASHAWQRTWPLFAVLGALLVFRISHSSLETSIIDKIGQYHMDLAQYLATWSMLLWWYVSRLFWPRNIVLIMAHQPLTQGIDIWIILLLVFIALAVYLLWTYRENKVMLLGLAWFFMGFGPFTLACFFQPIHGLMIEPHWFLFPVCGFFIFLAGVLHEVLKHKKFLAQAALCVVVFTSVFFSRWHNWVWGDEVRYCDYWLAESPSFVAVNGYLAKAYELRGEDDMARKHYYIMLNRGYKDYISYTNLGLMDMKEGKWDSAEKNFLNVMAIDPHASVTISDLGAIYFREGNYTKALEFFERASQLNPYIVLPYLNIAQVYLKLHNQDKAIDTLKQVLDIVPGEEYAMVDLIQIYMARHDREDTIKIAHMMVAYSHNPYTLRNAGYLLNMYGFPDEARQAISRARFYWERGQTDKE